MDIGEKEGTEEYHVGICVAPLPGNWLPSTPSEQHKAVSSQECPHESALLARAWPGQTADPGRASQVLPLRSLG